jgi:molybdate transport system substrate-binding protein
MRRRIRLLLLAMAFLSSCAAHLESPQKLTVAAAGNLTDVFGDVSRAFEAATGVQVILSFGSTSQLAQQIANGAPFDVFAAADTKHIDSLVATGRLAAGSRAIYALGQLAMWIPQGQQSRIRELKDLASERVRYIAMAQPELAPYGEAALEVLQNAGLWESVRGKIVYGTSINMAKQMASSGNADVALTAYSLVLHEPGTVVKLDPSLYHPIEQAFAITLSSAGRNAAKQFRTFLLGPEGRAIMTRGGYLAPPVR